MPVTVNYEIRHSASKLIARAKKTGREKGVKFQGDAKSGTASKGGLIPFKGNYTINGKTLILTITEKPLLSSWGFVKGEVSKWIKSNDIP